MATRILIITRSFVREINALTHYIANHDHSLQFHLVLPRTSDTTTQKFCAQTSLQHIFFPKRIRTATYFPSILSAFTRFRPHIIQVFEEYSGIMAFQTILWSKLFHRHSKIMVYSAENILHNVNPVFLPAATYVKKHSDLAFVCSHSVKTTLEREGFVNRISVFPLGVNTETFRPLSMERLRKELCLHDKFVLGYTGRLLEMKGIFLLLDIMRQLPENMHLLMLGDGPDENRLRQEIARHGLEKRIHLMGNVPYDHLPRYINCFDLGIVPSLTTPRWKEQFGRVLIELMSCEVPVIGSNSGSIPEVLGDTGYIFQEDDPSQLLFHIRQAERLPEERLTIGKKGRERVLSQYSENIMGKQFLTMYRKVRQDPSL